MSSAHVAEAHPVLGLWERHRRVAPYPEGVLEIDEAIPGRAFFPGGYGLWMADTDRSLPEWPLGGVMVLGHDFHSEHGYRDSLRRGAEPESQPTWRTLLALARSVGLPLERCFFTNVYMGLRQGRATTGIFPGASDPAFVERCRTFLLDQLDTQRPSVILTLGIHAPCVLSGLSDSLTAWRTTSGFRALDAAGALQRGVRFDAIGLRCTVGALVHPSLRGPNLRHRSYRGLVGAEAELELLRDAIEDIWR